MVKESPKMKRKLKSLIFWLNALIHRDTSPKTVFYHDVSKSYTSMGTPRELFWAHMAQLRVGDLVCFDDGFRGIWDERDTFKAQKIYPKVFLAVNLIGQANYLSWEEILILQRDYGFDFQCHTWSHQTLIGPYNEEVITPSEGRTDAWLKKELVDSKQELEARLGKPITELCFPVGYFSNDVILRCKDTGYERVWASYPGNRTEAYVQPRCLCQNLSSFEFGLILKGGMNPLANRYLKMHKI
jgi:peptidoglycan/xylan/chitin deacetylase (PgdA/CDA1 family)